MDIYGGGGDKNYSKLCEVTWTERMKKDLLRIFEEALGDFKGDEPPRYLENGRQIPVKELMFKRWEESGYGNLGLTPLDLQDQGMKVKYDHIVTNYDREAPVKRERLRKLLEELINRNEVKISDVAEAIRELDNSGNSSSEEEDIESEIKEKLSLYDDCNTLDSKQISLYLSNEIKVYAEEEILNAFKLFDETGTGHISIHVFDTIMDLRGTPLNEDERSEFEQLREECEVFEKLRDVEDDKGKEGSPANDDKDEELKRKSAKNVSGNKKRNKNMKNGKDITISEEDKKEAPVILVNYKDFVTKLAEKINQKEKGLRIRKD